MDCERRISRGIREETNAQAERGQWPGCVLPIEDWWRDPMPLVLNAVAG